MHLFAHLHLKHNSLDLVVSAKHNFSIDIEKLGGVEVSLGIFDVGSTSILSLFICTFGDVHETVWNLKFQLWKDRRSVRRFNLEF
jgi:hypothetical protein